MIEAGNRVKLKSNVGKFALEVMGIINEADNVLRVMGKSGPGAIVSEVVINGLCRFDEVIVWIPSSYLEVVK